MPSDRDRWARAEALFHELMDLPPAERTARAREGCGGDDALLQEVLSLIGASSDSFLAAPALEVAPLLDALGDGDDPLLGREVGEFKVRSRLGGGGMGVVYLARQESPARDVALKLMRPGLLSPSLTRRFAHEAEILGRLQHPGIAQIYGAGRVRTPGGDQPYFAMEYVRGEPLTGYVKARTLPLRERILLLAAVCDAVQHAHTKGVIHRDLKPGNILVSDVGPKILDFGVARLTETDVQVTANTSVGEVLGTLPYMSPEQVRGESAEIDTRTDVYALGVIIFEVLAGRLPLDLTGRSIAQAAPVILESEPPRLGALDPALRGDLEVIAAKALEKDKARRYQTAAEVAEDLRRHLADAPILARPPTTIYQLRKFARRNRALVAGAASALVLLVAGSVGTSIGLYRASAARNLAQRREREASIAATQAGRTVDFLTTILSSANPAISRGRELTVRELIDEAALRADTELAGQPEVEFRTRLALSRTYLSLNLVEQSRGQAERARELGLARYGARSVEFSEALAALASAVEFKEKSEASVAAARGVLELRLDLLPHEHRLVSLARIAYARSLTNVSRFEDAEKELRLAYDALRSASEPGFGPCAAFLAEVLVRNPDPERITRAQELLRPAIEELRARGPQAEPDLATVLLTSGFLHTRRRDAAAAEKDLAECVAIRSRIYPPNHPAHFTARLRLAQAIYTQDRRDEALEIVSDLVELERRVLGLASPDLVNAAITLGRIREEGGELELAARAYDLGAQASNALQDRLQAQICWQMQAKCLLDAGKLAEAEAPIRAALEIAKSAARRGFTFVALCRDLERVLAVKGEHRERVALAREALAFAEGASIIEDTLLDLRLELAAGLTDLGGAEPLAEAEPILRACFEARRAKGPAEKLPAAADGLASLLQKTGRGEEAARLRAAHPPVASPKPPPTEIHGVPAR